MGNTRLMTVVTEAKKVKDSLFTPKAIILDIKLVFTIQKLITPFTLISKKSEWKAKVLYFYFSPWI